MPLTEIKFLDTKILLQASYVQILAFASSNKYFYCLISNPEFMLQIISRDFNVQLSLNIPHSTNLINHYYHLNKILLYGTDIHFIQFLIATEQDDLLILLNKKYEQYSGKLFKDLISLRDFNSIKYLLDRKIGRLFIIESLIRQLSLNEILNILPVLNVNFIFDVHELKAAIQSQKMDIIKYIISNKPELLTREADMNGLIQSILRTFNIDIFQYFKPYIDGFFTNSFIMAKGYLVLCSKRNFEYLKFIFEEYNFNYKLSLESKLNVFSEIVLNGSIESINYMFSKLHLINKELPSIYLIHNYIRNGNIEMVKITADKIEQGDEDIIFVENIAEFKKKLTESCIISRDVEMMKYIFDKFNISYTNDLLREIVSELFILPQIKMLSDFLIQEKHLLFDESILDNVLSDFDIYPFDVVEYVLDNYEIHPVPENIIQKYTSLNDKDEINKFKFKRLMQKYA